MKTSIEGKAALAASEGVVVAVYLDSVGVPTFGIGVTHWAIGDEAFSRLPDAMPKDIDAAVDQALELFDRVLPQYEAAVNDAVMVELEQHEFDALVHFAYNVGGPNFRRSRLLRLLNAGNKAEAGRVGFHGWLKPKSLLGRRDFERNMFLNRDYGRKPIPVYGTNGARKLGRVVKTISFDAAVAMMRQPVKEEPAGHARVARDNVDQTMTAWLAKAQKWWATGNFSVLGVIAAIKDLDPMVQIALVAVVLLLGVAGAWTFSSLIRRERDKHFMAGVK